MTRDNLFFALTHPVLARWLTRLLAVALAAYVGIQTSSAAWALAWTEAPLPGLSAPDTRKHHQPATGSIAQYNLFGTPIAGQAKAPETIDAPETNLTLTLVGVMAGSDNSPSGAIIADSRGETEYYRVGESVPGNAELVRVDNQRILLKRAGKHETLSFEEAGQTSEQTLATRATSESTTRDHDASRNANERKGAENRKALSILSKAGMTPYKDGQGYTYNGQHATLNAIGLKAGDVITDLNGQRLGNPEQDADLISTWRQEPTIKITIKRGNSTRTLNYAQPNLQSSR